MSRETQTLCHPERSDGDTGAVDGSPISAGSSAEPVRLVNSPEVIERLVNENIKLAHFMANKWSFSGLADPAEALSNAMEGLAYAAKHFDPARGAFGGYAALAMKRILLRTRSERMRLKRGGGTTLHVAWDDPAFAREAGMTFAEVIADPLERGAFAILAEKDALADSGKVWAWLDGLDPRERRVIVARFGLDGSDTLTLGEVGEEFDVTRQRIGQIETIALGKLRAMAKRDRAPRAA